MEEKALIKRIPIMMWLSIGLTALMAFGALAVASVNANRIAAENSGTMIAGGFEAEKERISGVALDYSIWDAAHENVQLRDLEWIYDNMASAVTYGQFQYMELYYPEDQTSFAWIEDTDEELQAGSTSQEDLLYVQEALEEIPVGDYSAVVYITRQLGELYVMAATRIEPEDPALVEDARLLPINIMGSRLSAEAVMSMGERFLINDLHLEYGAHANHIALRLVGHDGAVLGDFAWTPPSPGMALLKASVIPLSLAFILFVGLTRSVGRTAKESVIKLVRKEKESATLARTDQLTGLPNRLAFSEHFATILDEKKHDEIALMFADVNGFKQVNDTKGHAAGDELVIALAKRINDTVTEDVFVARVGGDEFGVIYTGDDAEELLCGFAHALKSAVEPAFYLKGDPVHISMAMGYAVRESDDQVLADEFIRQADTAMYTSKAAKSAMLVRYDSDIDPNRLKELELETALNRALEDPDQFSMVYQPIYGGHGEKMDFAEALIRWNSPELGKVSPGDFIPIAESSGLIGRVTSLVLEKVCTDLAGAPDYTVSINISPIQINDVNFHEELFSTTARHGVRPEQIVIELTEGVLVENPRGLGPSIQRLRLMGFRIALDDFGTGYSSIGYLRQMEFSMLKVDKTLIQAVVKSPRSKEILAATIQIAKAMDIELVAEGVETAEQASALAEMGFDMQQGFNFSGAFPFGDLIAVQDDKKVA